MSFATRDYELYCGVCVRKGWRFTWRGYGVWKRARQRQAA